MSEQSGAGSAPTDSVDRVLASWATSRPDLDVRPIAILTRLDRLKRAVDEQSVFDRFGLNGADFAVLATLVRVAPSTGLSQRALMAELDLSSGTVSVRIERLVRSGLVTRNPDPRDGRGSIIVLTARGAALFEECAPVHLHHSRQLLSGLSTEQHDQLADLLRRLLQAVEMSTDDRAMDRWGMSLLPAHLAARRRTELGLTERAGLGIRAVLPRSPASTAGLKIDDLVVAAEGVPVLSVIDLHRATRNRDRISLRILRGNRARTVGLSLAPA
ncbi:MarR family transcriptional regulator [Microlunatus soli]|uniref:DNA-binding transcriptional regulator, MarR family n=1 Tax=Microlunatus soli TaxID=630515 RepID=A0A1H1QRL0_9ACTN|nr:MarR family transcriptional regulator [Microlunatus soli]SDS25539.1 DNA-binding transcriptional regulator, MarR family [Microlunatus soli]